MIMYVKYVYNNVFFLPRRGYSLDRQVSEQCKALRRCLCAGVKGRCTTSPAAIWLATISGNMCIIFSDIV